MIDSFGKRLVNGYFEQIKPNKVIVAKQDNEYKGIIICELIPGTDIMYLDKIAVSKEFQGEGIGKSLWDFASIDYSKFCWRAKLNNPINSFYKEKSDNSFVKGCWIVYYRKLNGKERKLAEKYALSKRSTLE